MSEESMFIDVHSNYFDVLRKIDESAVKAKRDSSDIALVGVTKKIEFLRISPALDAGLKIIGEVISTETKKKLPLIKNYSPSTEIHIVGLIQSNKAKFGVENCNLIQSLQSEKILSLINKFAQQNEKVFPVFLQVDFSNTVKPKGLNFKEVLRFIALVKQYDSVKIDGIMTIAPLEYEKTPSILRKFFAKTNKFFREDIAPILKTENPQLSMGMSGDYEIAIEEGSTMVRIGTAIFGPR